MARDGTYVSLGNGLPNSEIYSIWLRLPGLERPFLEIHQHKVTHDRPQPRVNEPGFAHLSFETDDIYAALPATIGAGGAPLGEVAVLGRMESPSWLSICVTRRETFSSSNSFKNRNDDIRFVPNRVDPDLRMPPDGG